ncbi:Hypothetical predicted protein [Paramuricea clavata]|uniref:Uncharacterized protein n=1 Tax=Paramuricea clavata TaxID=317549 RepID=A0A7D9JN29_PARCT|nr:Hypothetical predicted protein [Paramuricea clavata]
MAKAYPELCASTHGSAKKTKEQMLHDAFLGAIDNSMSQKIKSDSKHRDLNLAQLSEELDRLELVLNDRGSRQNIVEKEGAKQLHLFMLNASPFAVFKLKGDREQSSAKINSFSAAKKFITLTGTVAQSGSREFTCDSGAAVSVIPMALAKELTLNESSTNYTSRRDG